MTRLTSLIVLFLLMLLVRQLELATLPDGLPMAITALGFTLLAAYLLATLVTRLALPKLTGYILAGILFGPYVLNLLTEESVGHLRLIDNLALSVIALTAGGELRLGELKGELRAIISLMVFQTLLAFGGVTLFFYLARPLFPIFSGKGLQTDVAIALVFGVLAVAKSPASTIALITEFKARGRVTELVLGVTVLKDIVIITLFAVVLSVARSLVEPTTGMDVTFVGRVFWEVAGSVVAGVGIGWIMALYIRHIRGELVLVVLGVAYLITVLAQLIHLHGLLVAMTAGFWIENFTEEGEHFIEALERSSLPVYVVFFTIAGAALDLEALRQTWPLALFLVASRALWTFLGTYVGARVGDVNGLVRRFGWLGFLTQAGVSLGMATVVGSTFEPWGSKIKTAVVAAIALNQLLGPPAFRYLILRSGEAGRAGRG